MPDTTNTTPKPETMISSGAVAQLLHVSPKTVSRWAKEGKLPYRRTLGGHRRYPLARIRAIAERLEGSS